MSSFFHNLITARLSTNKIISTISLFKINRAKVKLGHEEQFGRELIIIDLMFY